MNVILVQIYQPLSIQFCMSADFMDAFKCINSDPRDTFTITILSLRANNTYVVFSLSLREAHLYNYSPKQTSMVELGELLILKIT